MIGAVIRENGVKCKLIWLDQEEDGWFEPARSRAILEGFLENEVIPFAIDHRANFPEVEERDHLLSRKWFMEELSFWRGKAREAKRIVGGAFSELVGLVVSEDDAFE